MKRLICLALSVVLLMGLLTAGVMPASAVTVLEPSEEMIALLKMLEGFDRYPRWDYAQWTVGYGTACPSSELERLRRDGITVAEAEEMLQQHLAGFVKTVNSFNVKYSLEMTQNEFDAILMFTYNMGHAWMFRETNIRSALVNGKTGNDLLYAMGQWSHAGGEILTQLVKRRLMEYNMFVNGVYSRTVPDNYCYVLYELNGGEAANDVQCYDSNLTDVIRVTPTREGYRFDGWYTMNAGGVKVTVLDASVRNMTLYARWTKDGETSVPENPGDTTPEENAPMDPVTVTVSVNNVNIRSGPGTNYSVVKRVKKDVQMTITEIETGTGYTWGKFEGGWIALMYTNYEELMGGEPPTTEPPTTEPPTTEPPTTEPPTTEPPTTEPPTTEPPTTEPPTTEPPTTEPPTTEPPTTEPPTTEPPTTEPPTTEPPTTEPPTTEPAKVMGTVTANALRIRSGAGTGYQVKGFLNAGDRVEILEQKTVGAMTWGRIEKGWISMTYVILDAQQDPPAEEPPETVPPTTEPPETEPNHTAVMGTITTNVLRVRSDAGTSFKIVGYVMRGDRVEILEQKTVGDVIWGRIGKGWISMEYVKLDDQTQPPATEPPTTEPPTTEPPTTEPPTTEPPTTEPPTTEPPTTEPPTTESGADGTMGTVTTLALRIRKGPGTGYKMVGYICKGDRVEILEMKTAGGMTWGRIKQGWISLDYVELDKPQGSDPVTMTVNTDCLRVRSGAGLNNRVVGFLYYGAKVQILESKEVDGMTWARLENGWVSMDYLVS